MSEPTTDAQAVIDAAQRAAEPQKLEPGGVFSVIVPAGASQQTLDLEHLEDVPRRARGTVTVQTVDDLARYVTRHDDPHASTLWVDADGHRVEAVLNDHPAGEAAWGDHRAVLTLKPTPEWQRWAALDGKLVSQEQFAEHIELGLPEILEPDAATMLEIAQSIEGTKSADFKSGRRLQDGNVAIEYVETTTTRAGQKGELDIPQRFKLAIAPFLGEEPSELVARFRYRITAGDVRLGYLLERPDLVVRQTVDDIADRLARTFGPERLFVGRPRS